MVKDKLSLMIDILSSRKRSSNAEADAQIEKLKRLKTIEDFKQEQVITSTKKPLSEMMILVMDV